MAFAFDPKSELPLVLGGNVFGKSADRDASFAVLDAFLDAGGSQLDTADRYADGRSEAIIGEWLSSRGCRDRVFLATKVGARPPYDNLRAGTIARAVEESLRRLRTDYLDLYWAHQDDPTTTQQETLAAFDLLVKAGKVRYLGASNFTADRLQSALKLAARHRLTRYEAVQPHYNLLEHADWESGAGRVALAFGLATWPYFGLASGFLTGKYRPGLAVQSVRAEAVARYRNERGYRVLAELDRIADAHRISGAPVSVAAVALRWLAQQPGVLAPIASARTPEQLAELLQVADFSLDESELAALRSAAG